jgi:hypothetical protein
MPFSLTGLAPIGNTSNPLAAPTLWSYRSTDTMAVISAANYFNGAAGMLRAGDHIFLHADTGGTPRYNMAVVASVSAGVVTLGAPEWGPANGRSVLALAVPITVLAQANTDFTVPVQDPARIFRATMLTTTAFTGATVALSLGSSAGGAQIVNAADVKAAGAAALTLVGTAGWSLTGGTLFGRMAQTTPTNVGAGTLIVEFIR